MVSFVLSKLIVAVGKQYCGSTDHGNMLMGCYFRYTTALTEGCLL